MRRKFLSVVLCVCMMLTMAPFAFAKGSDDTSTTNTQEQAPVANSSSSGSGGSTTSVSLPKNNTGNLTISTNNAVLDGRGLTYTNGTITVTAANVTIQNLTFGDKAALVVNTTGEFTLTGCTFTPTTTYAKGSNNQTLTSVRTAVTLNVGEAVVTNNTFDGVTGGYYNAIEFGINGDGNNLSHATITGNTFNSAIQNNYFNFYNMTEGATIDIESNHFLLANKGSNAIRISNFRNVSGVTFNVNNNEYTYANDSDESQYEGFILLEDYSPEGGTVQDFSGITININNLTSPSNAKQLFYVYDDQDHIIARNQPIVKGDSSIAKFCSARICDTYYASLANAVAAANNSEVTLLKDVTLNSSLTVDKKMTLDLGGHTWKATGVKAVYVAGNGDLTLQNGTLESVDIATNLCVAQVDCTATTVAGDAKLTIAKDMTVRTNQGCGIALFGSNSQYKATLSVAGKVYGGNQAVSGNGSWSNTDITIEDGAVLTSSDGTAIYHPQGGTLYIKGGTITGRDSAIAIKSGTLNISGGTIKATGPDTTPTTGYSNGVNASGAAIQIESNKNYCGNPDITNYNDTNAVQLNVTGGNIESQNGVAIYEYLDSATTQSSVKGINISAGYIKSPKANFMLSEQLSADKASKISVTGGYFTSDPTAYLATGKAAVESDLAGYNYKVANKSNAPATVASAAPTVDTDGLSTDQLKVATEIANKLDSNAVTGDGLTAAAKTVANNNTVNQTEATNALTKEGITPTTDQTVRIVVQTYMNINIKNVDTNSADKKTLSLDITPMYRTVATTANTDSAIRLTGADVTDANAVLVGPAGKLIINKPVTIKIPLPTGFVSPATTDANAYPSIYVQHKGYEYTATVSKESDTLYATFTNPHGFSTFTITTEQTAEATLNGVNYTSFQDAVNAANNGDVITALKDNLSATMSGSSRTITVKNGSAASINVTVNGDKQTLQSSSSHNFTYTRPSSGGPGSSGGSISTPTTYAVNVNAATNGAVAADKKTASKGTTVTVTASPSKGYVVDAVKVVDKDGKDVAVTGKDGKYVFTMPGSAVTVTGTFKAETPAPVALPFTDVKSGNWFYDAVKYAYAQGLMTGTSATTFAPNGTMNRAMIVTVLYRLEKSPAVTGASKFTDVPAGQWYSDAVAWAAANKIVNGYDETTFGPMNAVTREQMAAILFRYEQVKGLENVTLEENLNRFPDQNKISPYAIPALQWAVGQKIINGNADGTLDPTGTATRAQVAQIFTNLLNK